MLTGVKESITYVFDYLLGIKLNISNCNFDDNNNILIQLTNINIEANRINHNYLKDINIKLTKGLVEKMELRVGFNTLEIKSVSDTNSVNNFSLSGKVYYDIYNTNTGAKITDYSYDITSKTSDVIVGPNLISIPFPRPVARIILLRSYEGSIYLS